MSLIEFESSFEVPFKVKLALETELAPCTDLPEAWWGNGNTRGSAGNDKSRDLTTALDRFQSWHDEYLEFFRKRGGSSDIDRWFVGTPYVVEGKTVGLLVHFYDRLGGFPFKRSSYSFLCVGPGSFLIRWGEPG